MSTQIAPPLDVNFASIDTSFQLLADGVYDFTVIKSELKPTQKGGKMIHLEMGTQQPAPSRSNPNEMLNPGVRVFHNQNTMPTGKATWDIVLKGPSGLAALFQSAGLQNEVNMQNLESFGVAALNGRKVTASIGFEKAGQTVNGKTFREKNVINYWVTKR